jgi:hypothetical protein
LWTIGGSALCHSETIELRPGHSRFTKTRAARPGEAGDNTKPDRVFGDTERDGDRRGCRYDITTV